jgi:hypothetical protein
VLWLDWNDVIIDMNTDVRYGVSLADIQRPNNPTRLPDIQYTYTFVNWMKN